MKFRHGVSIFVHGRVQLIFIDALHFLKLFVEVVGGTAVRF